MNKALLLVNIGSPDNPSRKSVRNFLRAFLNDRRVVDISGIFRFLLVNFIIVPFRAGRSARLYRRIWTDEGSPVTVNLKKLVEKLNIRWSAGQDLRAYGIMRHGKPSFADTLARIRGDVPDEIILMPLFPQYASSTSGSAADLFLGTVKTWDVIPHIRIISSFHDHPAFIKAFSERILSYNPHEFDHILFSYHGLPLRHLKISAADGSCEKCTGDNGSCLRWCYKAACYETTRLIKKRTNIPGGMISVGFQSRMSSGWIGPFTDELIKDYAVMGIKRILVAAPSFVSDCLETLSEIEIECRKIFLDHGGEELTLVKSLNYSDNWIDALIEITGARPAD